MLTSDINLIDIELGKEIFRHNIKRCDKIIRIIPQQVKNPRFEKWNSLI